MGETYKPRRWVRAKREIFNGSFVVPKGAVGFIHSVATRSVVRFAAGTIAVQPDDVEELELPTVEEAIEITKMYKGAHCASDYEFQFRIKVENYDVPEEVANNDYLFDRIEMFIEEEIKIFSAHLIETFSLINYCKEKGFDGCLVIEFSVSPLFHAKNLDEAQKELEDLKIIYDLRDVLLALGDIDHWDYGKLHDFIEADRKDISLLRSILIDLALDMKMIEEMVDIKKKSIEEQLSSIECYEQIIGG